MAEADPLPVSSHAAAAPVYLEERERDVLTELARLSDAEVSFQGLRRQLGLHQQALARTLRRLAAQGLVAHEGRGYQLTDAGTWALRGQTTSDDRPPALPIVTALLPPHIAREDVAAHLSRRWFGGLRWYGRSEGPGETTLHWLVEGAPEARSRVSVRVTPGNVTLEIDDAPGAESPNFSAARPVLAALSELYGGAS